MNGVAVEEMRVPGRNFAATGQKPQMPPPAAPKRSPSKRATSAGAALKACAADTPTPGCEGSTRLGPPRKNHLERVAKRGLPIVGPAGSIN